MSQARVKVVAHLIAKADRVNELKELALSVIAPTRQEKGCIKYELFQNQADPTDLTFVEEWESNADLDTHLASAHIQQAIAKLDDVAVAPPDIRRYQLIQ